MEGREVAAYWVYQLSSIGFFVCLFFLTVRFTSSPLSIAGLLCHLPGLDLCAASLASFARPDAAGLNTGGLYRFSRHPMYVSYFHLLSGYGAFDPLPAPAGHPAALSALRPLDRVQFVEEGKEAWDREKIPGPS